MRNPFETEIVWEANPLPFGIRSPNIITSENPRVNTKLSTAVDDLERDARRDQFVAISFGKRAAGERLDDDYRQGIIYGHRAAWRTKILRVERY